MEITHEGLRLIIFYIFEKGLIQQQCVESILATFGNEALSVKTVYNWFAKFGCGQAPVSDKRRDVRIDQEKKAM